MILMKEFGSQEAAAQTQNLAKFTAIHVCQSVCFNKVAGFRSTTSLKKRLRHKSFPVKFAKFPRTPFLTEHLRWPSCSLATAVKLKSA